MMLACLVVFLFCFPTSAQAATVIICPEGATGTDCYVFSDVPPCEEWSLSSSTCTDILARAVTQAEAIIGHEDVPFASAVAGDLESDSGTVGLVDMSF